MIFKYSDEQLYALIRNICNELETKAMPLLRHCNTGRTCLPLPITTRENNSIIHIVQKITIICAQKIGKFAV